MSAEADNDLEFEQGAVDRSGDPDEVEAVNPQMDTGPAVPQVDPEDDGVSFFFKLTADQVGVKELTFRKNAQMVVGTLLFVAEYINGSFDSRFPSTGDFLRSLAESADQLDQMRAERGEEHGQETTH